MNIKFINKSNDIYKKVIVSSQGKLMREFYLSDKAELIEMDAAGELSVEVAYEKKKSKKILGLIVYLISLLFQVNGDEIVQSLYIDTLRIKEVNQDIEIKYSRKKPYFSVSSNIEHDIQRKVNKQDYTIVFFLFFLPAIAFFAILFVGFMVFNIGLIMKVVFGLFFACMIGYFTYLASSLYMKTK